VATGNGEGSTRRVDGVVRFGVLGPVTVTEGTTTLNIGGPKQRAVLAKLIAYAGDPVSVDSIIEAVWGDAAASNAKRIVQTYVATLRSEVGDAIVKAGSGWRLDVARDQIDAAVFEDLYRTARDVSDSNPQRASVALREALAMWRGHPYSDIEAHGALEGEISRLTELRVAAQAARIDADLALGRDADLVGEIEALMAEHPYSERFRAQHMLALYRAGRQKEALRSYEQMRSVLLEELGVDPTPDLQELEGRILDQDDSLRVAPTQTIQRRAVLVADPGDPIEIGHLPALEREDLLARAAGAVQSAIRREGDGLTITAGTTTYVVFDNALAAANVAEAVTRRLDGEGVRMAIDWGDMVLENGRVSGPPVSRAAVMAAVAHKGQVVLSADAQQAIGTSGSGRGLRFENLGSYDLHGVEGSVLIYQLLVGDMPPVFPDLETHRLPPPLPGGGDRSVPGYELREALGPGSVGTLYRAFQPSVGREVLVEVIGRGESSDAEFVRNFEADAHRLTLLDHQNIAQVIDYWRQPDGAFLVYRFPRGGLLSQGASVDAGRLIEQIGSALSYAHSLGMAHGSVRPDRVALDEAGNASLLCFPIAGVLPDRADEYERFVAPEGGSPAVAPDIYSLGVLANDLGLEGPAIERATDTDPAQRQLSVSEFLIHLNPVDSDDPADRYTETRNPYKGLAAFHERDAADFFGRAAATDELCRALAGSHLLAIVGPSGIGKSSVARAGLTPALRSGRLPGSERWLITDMLPGSHPFFELQRALERVAIDLPVDLTERLAAQRPDALSDVAQALPDGADLLVLVDQFEELFTMVSEGESRAFLNLLTTSIHSQSVRFVFTLRADFLDRPLRYSGFGSVLKASTVMLAAPNQDELAEAIARPAQGVGVEVAPELVERMVVEVHDEPGALPLLQHTLGELFKSRHTDLIGMSDFDEVGGVTGSLSKRAESIYGDLTGDGQSRIKQVLLRLVTIVDESAPTRRRVRLTDLDDLDAQASIDAFARSRLLVYDNDPETRTPTVEVAHEALLTHWPRLAGWIDGAREDLGMSRRLDEARRDWEGSGRDPGYLLTGGRLAQHQAWTSSTSLVLTEPDREYLSESIQHEDRRRTTSRRRRSLVLAGFAMAAVVASIFALLASSNASRADAERLVASASSVGEEDPELGLLLALQGFRESPSLAAKTAINQGLQTQRELMVIEAPQGSGRAIGAIDPAGELVAVGGAQTSTVQMWKVGADAPLWDVSVTDDETSVLSSLPAIWFSSDGQSLFVPLSPRSIADEPGVSDSPAGGIYELDVATGEVRSFVHVPCFFRASPAGTQFANGPLWAIDRLGPLPDGTCDFLGAAEILDFDTGETVFTMPIESSVEPTISADGRLLAVTASWPEGGPYSSSADYPDDVRYFDGVRVVDTVTGTVVFEDEVFAAAVISPDGRHLLTDRDPSYLYDLDSGERLQTFQGLHNRMRFVGDGSLVATSSPSTGAAQVFDAESGAMLLSMPGGNTNRISLSEDGSVMATSDFATVRVWDSNPVARGHLEPLELPAYDDLSVYRDVDSAFYLDALSVVGPRLLARRAGLDFVGAPVPPIPYRVDVVNLSQGERLWGGDYWAAELGPGDVAFVQRLLDVDVVSPQGVAGSMHIGRPELVDAGTGSHLMFLEGCEHYWVPMGPTHFENAPGCDLETAFNFFNIGFSADGSTLVGATALGATVVWDLESGEIIRTGPPELTAERYHLPGYRWATALSPDGNQIMVPPGADEWAIHANTGELPAVEIQDVHSGRVSGSFTVDRWVDFMTYVPAIDRYVGSGTSLLVVDPSSWETIQLSSSQPVVITDMDISPDGTRAATVNLDNLLAVWDLESGSLVAELPVVVNVGEGLRGVAFIDDQTIAVAPETSDRVLRFTLDEDVLVGRATAGLNRGFHPEECATYDIDPCPTLEEMRSRS
jgi:DNA-binding SARP family transcriptional activator/serine/threonine protein kinase/WD40 repeat protein